MLRNLVAAFCAAAIFIFMDVGAEAHSSRSGPLPSGLPIPALTHGQMAVVTRYRNAIVDLANRETVTDPDFRRLLNYSNIQSTYCLWGLMPGTITDEKSPFNECAHAYLAATKAVLDHMESMPQGGKEATQLIEEINSEMFRDGAAWNLCEFSAEPFSTGQFIIPHWTNILFHWPSLLTALSVLLLAATGCYFLFRGIPPVSGPPTRGG